MFYFIPDVIPAPSMKIILFPNFSLYTAKNELNFLV